MASTFYYSKQTRRWLLQIQRVFSNFEVEYGRDENGNTRLQTVPVRFGDASRLVGSIMRGNSENKVIPTPMIGFYITGIDYRRDMVQDPNHIDKVHVRQRKYDENTGELLTTQGNAFTVERLMPIPYMLKINADIWTTNYEQKFQLFEQFINWFNPSLEMQSTDNFIDHTSLSRMELVGNTWSSRAIPAGIDEAIDIATMNFEIPIWYTPPAKVKKLGVVKTVVASVFDESGSLDDGVIDNALVLGTRVRTTWQGYGTFLLNGQVKLLEDGTTVSNQNDELATPAKTGTDTVKWKSMLDAYGDFQNGISQMRFLQPDDTEVIGTVTYHPSDDYVLLFNVDTDTIPTNTETAITAIIDPLQSGPDAGLTTATTGQRYLITQDIGDAGNTPGPTGWGGTADLIASANDIIEYDGAKWTVDFDASATTAASYVTNLTTVIQYKWDGTMWLKSYEGLYGSGEWVVVIQTMG